MKQHEVIFHSYPKLLFAWPLIAVGLLFWVLHAVGLLPDPAAGYSGWLEACAWLYVFTASIVVLTIGVDIERNHAFVWVLLFTVFFLLGMWLSAVQGFTLFGNIYGFFAAFDLQFDPQFGLAMAVILGIPYCVMLGWARLENRWRVTHNEFERRKFGSSEESLARGAKSVTTRFPDLLELLLAGSGTLVVRSATSRTLLREIPHIPMILVVRRKIDRLMETTAVTSYSTEAAAISEEESSDETEGGGEPL